MGVPCQRCGREYDVTLFEFGRTLWCTCGSRVGLEPRARRLGPGVEKRFIADAMLGRLARWLRLLGFDCAYDSDISDADLVRRGVLEERIVLSRDRALPEEWWVSEVCVLEAQQVREQLVEVLQRFRLAADIRLLSRCADCNRALRPADREAVAGRVPAGVWTRCDAFSECPGCGRVYWEGSHTERIRRFVDGLLGAARRSATGFAARGRGAVRRRG